MHQLHDLLTDEELQRYNSMEYPFNIPVLHKALKTKLLIDPDYEVFVPFVYYKSTVLGRAIKFPIIQPHKVFISNKGNVLSLREPTPLIMKDRVGDKGYPVSKIVVDKRPENFFVHRAVACCFVPVDEELGPAHPKELEVNHIDGVKTNYDFDNLEWTNHLGNREHAVLNGLRKIGATNPTVKPMKGTVLSGKHAGYEFLLFGVSDCEKYGFTNTNVGRCCLGKGLTHRKCSWSFATEEEVKILPHGVSDEIINYLRS